VECTNENQKQQKRNGTGSFHNQAEIMYKPKIGSPWLIAAISTNAVHKEIEFKKIGLIDKCNKDYVIVNEVRLTIAKILG